MKIRLVPKASFSADVNQQVYFRDVCDAWSDGSNIDKLLNTVVYEGAALDTFSILKASELLKIASEMYEDAQIDILKSEAVVIMVQSKKDMAAPLRKLTNGLIYLLIFFGSALSVMYFHIDVGMLETQQEFARVFGNDSKAAYMAIAISYSIGLAGGMFVFFRNRKIAGNKIPSPIDLKMKEYKNDVVDFLRDKLEEAKEGKSE